MVWPLPAKRARPVSRLVLASRVAKFAWKTMPRQGVRGDRWWFGVGRWLLNRRKHVDPCAGNIGKIWTTFWKTYGKKTEKWWWWWTIVYLVVSSMFLFNSVQPKNVVMIHIDRHIPLWSIVGHSHTLWGYSQQKTIYDISINQPVFDGME